MAEGEGEKVWRKGWKRRELEGNGDLFGELVTQSGEKEKLGEGDVSESARGDLNGMDCAVEKGKGMEWRRVWRE